MADHIKIHEIDGTWVLRAGGAVLGETTKALELREGDLPPVIYFPCENIAVATLEKSDTTSHCPHKGEASYYSLQTQSGLIKDAGWSYETPNAGVEAIAGHLAFYADKAMVEPV